MTEAEFNRRLAETTITHDDAQKIALRLISGAFNNPDNRPRFTIPTRYDDDDVLIMEYIRRQRIVESNSEQHDRDCTDMRYQRDAAEGSANDAWRHAAAQSLASYPAVAILRARWLESAQRAQAFATDNPETPEQWRAYGAAETQFALADELEDVKFAENRTVAEERVSPAKRARAVLSELAVAPAQAPQISDEMIDAGYKTLLGRFPDLQFIRIEISDIRAAIAAAVELAPENGLAKPD